LVLPDDLAGASDTDAGVATHTFAIVEGSSGEQEEVIVISDNADGSLARSQLRTVVEGLITDDLLAEEPDDGGKHGRAQIQVHGAHGTMKVSPYVTVPRRGVVSTQQLVAELNRTESVDKLSKDRLTRVAQRGTPVLRRTMYQVGANSNWPKVPRSISKTYHSNCVLLDTCL
jgi:hypothetical protein